MIVGLFFRSKRAFICVSACLCSVLILQQLCLLLSLQSICLTLLPPLPTGGNFTLAELGVCEQTPPPHPAAVPYCPDLGLLQRGYSLSAGSDADSDPEGPLSPERAIQLWAGRAGVKSRRSSGVSSRENSALTLTDSENDNKSDDESGRPKDCSKCCRDSVCSVFPNLLPTDFGKKERVK